MALLFLLDYDAGWNWQTFEYRDFWFPAGFARSLFFNGFHPVFPWMGFLAGGMALARLPLSDRKTQTRILLVGIVLLGAGELSAAVLRAAFAGRPDLAPLFGTGPMPPTPLYALTGGGAALILTGGRLLAEPFLRRRGWLRFFTAIGRQTLTLYLAHILLGMGLMEAVGLLDKPRSYATVFSASALFLAAAQMFVLWHSARFRRGPVESLMRRATR